MQQKIIDVFFRWASFEVEGLTYLLLLSGHRVAPLATKVGSDGSDGAFDPRRVTTSVLFRWQGDLVPVQTVETDAPSAAVAFEV